MTLEDLLGSRDARVARQRELLAEHPGMSLLCLTVQLPGPVKRNGISLKIAGEGVDAIRESFSPVFEDQRDLETGFEAFFLVNMPPFDAKRLACSIEDGHPLGRLMDIDVIVPSEGVFCSSEVEIQPLGREALGLPPRKCLLCDNDVRICMRARTHTTEELLAKISEMVGLC